MLTIARVVFHDSLDDFSYGLSQKIWMVSKVIERGVSISLFWRDVVRNVDCSDFYKNKIGHFFCPVVMFWLACVKYLIILEAVKNRRFYAFCFDFSDKIFWLGNDAIATDEHHALLNTFSGMSCRRLRCVA